MSWQDWFRNLWRPDRAGDAPAARRGEPTSTEEYDARPSASLVAGDLRLRYGVVSITGNVREHNEDNFYVPGRGAVTAPPPPLVTVGTPARGDDTFSASTTVDIPTPGPQGLFIVADGMGGQLAGEKASEMAVEVIPREVIKRVEPGAEESATKRALRDSIAKANDEILALSHIGTDFAHMGTTVVLAHFQDGRAYVAGIGDSRCYRLRGDKLEQLTRDHSLANALGEAGTIRPEEVENHKFKHVLYLYLGSKDARDGPEEVRVLDVRPGDQFLLATDGLMGVVRDDLIRDILLSYKDPQKAAQALVDRALELRSKDNITAVVIHLE